MYNELKKDLSWEHNNMLLRESLPVEDRNEYQAWKKDFEDNETSRRGAKRKQSLDDKYDLFFDTIRTNLEDTVDVSEIDLSNIVKNIVYKKSESTYNYIGMLDNDIEVYTAFYNDYDFKHHTYNENIDHFFEAPFYIGFFINSKNIPEFEGNVYKFLSKLRYRQFANLLREGVIEDIVVEPDDTLVIMLTFDTLTDKQAVDRIVNAFKEAVESDNRDM